MIDDLLLRAGLAGLGVALATGPLGCFVVWRRMAYFGDATAHAAVLGVAVGVIAGVAPVWGVLVFAALTALLVTGLEGRFLSSDGALGVVAHGALALGLTVLALSGVQISLEGVLFGEILAVGPAELALIWGGAALVLGLLIWRWDRLLTATLSPELAAAEGGAPRREGLIMALLLAVVVAVALKVVGALLVTALLIIPAAAARPLARSPEAMAVAAAGLGGLAVVLGLAASWELDAPTGPAIIVAAAAIFACLTTGAALARRAR